MIPNHTHLQFLLLDLLWKGELSGSELREKAAKAGATKMSKVSFYQMMARFEADGLVSGRYLTDQVNGHTVKTRHYKLRTAGVLAVDRLQQFYLKRHSPRELAIA